VDRDVHPVGQQGLLELLDEAGLVLGRAAVPRGRDLDHLDLLAGGK
jgi:hypothetical protein